MSNFSLAPLFDPVSPELWFGFEHYSYLNQRIRIFHENFPDLTGVDIALIGILEDRGNPDNEGAHSGADGIRRALYGLRASHVSYNIADLGNLRLGNTLEDSHERIKEVVRVLLENQVLPVLIGGTHDATLPVVWAFEELGKQLNLVNIDARSDTEASAHKGMAHHHFSRILTRHKATLNRYIHLAYQTYLVDENILAAIDQHHHFKLRIGELRDDFEQAEPILRSGDFVSFDVSAIRMSEAPGNAGAFPFGLTGEEACQLAWYAGNSPRLSVFGIFEFNPGLDYRETTGQLLGTMLWYFFEGYYHRIEDLSFSPASYKKHSVLLGPASEDEFTFFQHIVSGKWWMEVPGPDGEMEMIPCREEDYKQCQHGQVPSRWLNHTISLS